MNYMPKIIHRYVENNFPISYAMGTSVEVGPWECRVSYRMNHDEGSSGLCQVFEDNALWVQSCGESTPSDG